MTTLHSLVPDVEVVLAMEPEDLAGVLLNYMQLQGKHAFSRSYFGNQHIVRDYPDEFWSPLLHVIMEAWAWLEQEGLLVKTPESQMSGDMYFISRRGHQIVTLEDLTLYRQKSKLPHEILHVKILQKTQSLFLRGDYDTAVFQAFKELEIAVRQAAMKLAPSSFSLSDVGVDLMRKALADSSKGNAGPLTDPTELLAEQQALAHLFAGAYGRFRNPTGHRTVGIEVDEAVELLMLASRLMKIVDERS